MNNFYKLIFGQTLSSIGTSLTGFALSIWIFDKTKDPTILTFQASLVALSYILTSFISGGIIDRFNRKKIILFVDSIAFINTFTLLLFIKNDSFSLFYFYFFIFVNGVLNTIQTNAYSTSIPFLVKKDQLFKANSYARMSFTLTYIVAPLLGAYLVGQINLDGVIFIDMITFIVSMLILVGNRIPDTLRESKEVSILLGIRDAFVELEKSRELKSILLIQVIANVFVSVFLTLIIPFVLMKYNEESLGLILSSGSMGSFLGSYVATKLNIERSKIKYWLFTPLFSTSLLIMISGQINNSLYYSLIYFLILLQFPLFGTILVSEWQREVPKESLGRMNALKGIVLRTTQLVATLIAGIFAVNSIMASKGFLIVGLGLMVYSVISILRTYLKDKMPLGLNALR